MEENSLIPKKNNFLESSAFLEVGMFETFFVVIILAIFFGVMNYFNILPISALWPNQFSFLPHRPVSTKNNIGLTTYPKISPTPNLHYSANVFQYDSEKAKTLLTEYIKDNIKPEFLPAKIEVKQGLSIDNRQEDIKYQFGAYLVRNQETISINFHYKENANAPNDFTIFIKPSVVEQKTLNSTLANSLLSSYFVNPYSPIESCEKKGTTSYCEIFKIESDGKKGYGVLFGDDISASTPKLTPIVFNCFIPKESKDYDKQSSCISP